MTSVTVLSHQSPRQKWIICERCWRGAQTRVFNPQHEPEPQWCARCDLDPDTLSARQAEVDRRVLASECLPAPDERRIWLHRPGWPYAHLFTYGYPPSFCGSVAKRGGPSAIDRPARAVVVPCYRCLRSYALEYPDWDAPKALL
jgi:hypothetical protein